MTSQETPETGEQRLRVMVVDDHPMWRDGVARDLTEAGFDVVATAATGTEALTRAAASRGLIAVASTHWRVRSIPLTCVGWWSTGMIWRRRTNASCSSSNGS